MANEVLNIVGEITRADAKKLRPAAESADYAQLNPTGEFIQMWYKKLPIDQYVEGSPEVWHYLSFANLWMGSSDDITKKKLLKVV